MMMPNKFSESGLLILLNDFLESNSEYLSLVVKNKQILVILTKLHSCQERRERIKYGNKKVRK